MRFRERLHKEVSRRIRLDRRRLGCFVVFAEMLADLRPISLFNNQAAPARKRDQVRLCENRA